MAEIPIHRRDRHGKHREKNQGAGDRVEDHPVLAFAGTVVVFSALTRGIVSS